MVIVLFDNRFREQLFPLTLTKAVADLRCGILTFKERWELITGQEVFIKTVDYLSALYAPIQDAGAIWIDAGIIADMELADRIFTLKDGQALADENGLIAGKSTKLFTSFSPDTILQLFDEVSKLKTVKRLQYPGDIVHWNDCMIRSDYELITKNKTSQPISHTNQIIHQGDIFIEENATVEFCTLNSANGPIYIAKDAILMEGSMIRGPFALGENSLLKMGTKIYGATSIGPNCVVGGEIKNVVIQGNSNKAHDGYLGDSVIGEWCNLGAGTSNSNVKNTGGEVMLWNRYTKAFMPAGQKCGVVMGDYSRTAINSSINTGSIIGVCCNVFGEGLLPKVIDDFSWGLNRKYELEKAMHDINNWKKMKHQQLSAAEISVLEYIFAGF
jgi:UDP-N-acetylglucosamine diphosphorylase/glucosamine-1-phosphate N-acetyltransferase